MSVEDHRSEFDPKQTGRDLLEGFSTCWGARREQRSPKSGAHTQKTCYKSALNPCFTGLSWVAPSQGRRHKRLSISQPLIPVSLHGLSWVKFNPVKFYSNPFMLTCMRSGSQISIFPTQKLIALRNPVVHYIVLFQTPFTIMFYFGTFKRCVDWCSSTDHTPLSMILLCHFSYDQQGYKHKH